MLLALRRPPFLPAGFLAAVLLGLLVAAAPGKAASRQPVLTGVRIEIVDPPPTGTDFQVLARSLIGLEAGRLFSEKHLRQAIAVLEECNRFHKIHVDAEEEADGMRVIFQLTPFRRVKEIQVSGAYPLFERKVLNAMTLFPGSNFVPEALARQKAAIEQLYRREGYIDPQVALRVREDPVDGHKVVEVDIVKGSYYRLAALRLAGNRAFSDRRLRLKMAAWRWSKVPGSGGRFVQKRLDKDLKDIVAFYRRAGYPECTADMALQKEAASATAAAGVCAKA
jgi:outer membrane protein insertion porin family